jgi:hypothetical protein
MEAPEVVQIVATTLRIASQWYEVDSHDLLGIAHQVEEYWSGMCCPLCEEVECDQGCPLEHVRAASEGDEL